MTASGGSDMVLMMLLGVTVVIITIRVAARAYRIKQEAFAKQATAVVRQSIDDRASQRDSVSSSETR
jgi:hypothetical protein